MTDTLAIALAQLNPTVGDIDGNAAQVRRARAEAKGQGADLVIYSELNVCGYPPEDLVLKPAFQERCEAAVKALAAETADGGPALLIGSPWRNEGKLHNAAVLLADGEVAALRYKCDLPNYGVFDEKRVFVPGPPQGPVSFRGVRLGVMVCEDMWNAEVTECLAETGSEILMLGNGSPYEHEKHAYRIELAAKRVAESGLPIIYVNQVGGQDELVFDGASFALDPDGSVKVQLAPFRETVSLTRWKRQGAHWRCTSGDMTSLEDGLEGIYQAMVLGLRDYVNKNRFPGVILGLSGGIDSSVVAAIAVDALGAERVYGVSMPSDFSSEHSRADAEDLATRTGLTYLVQPIQPMVDAFLSQMSLSGMAVENLQARVRGVILMALSNQDGHLVLTTGNKSELAVGYSTLYGDSVGGFNPLKDVPKTMVWRLANWRDAEAERADTVPPIPPNAIAKPPSAELRPGQLDTDSLPPYEELDEILSGYVDGDLGRDDLVDEGHDPALVDRVLRMVDVAEYKRRQSAPGTKISIKAFGRDRRLPITNRFRENMS